MAKTVSNILQTVITLIKKGDGDKEAVQALTNLKSAATTVGMAAGVMGAAWIAVDQVLKATVGELVDYASEVRNVQFLTGATAEESSRLIQVADDMKIGYDELARAMQKATKEGVTPNIEGLAQLSDQYLALAPGAERAAFLQEKFGKNSQVMAEMMSKGGPAIHAMSDAIDKNLILTQQAVDTARLYEMQFREQSLLANGSSTP